jgi:tetratricopeptide (TPR) repeat protein
MRTDPGTDTPTQRLDRGDDPVADAGASDEALNARLLGIPERPLPGGTTLGRFVLLARLGAGGMGVVYAAYDPELDRKVALKLVQAARERGRSSSGPARLLREAQAMARLSHPNVVTVYEVGAVGDQVFIAMEFVRGQTLSSWCAGPPRPWPEVLAAYVQAGRGLAAAHRAGVVHRDFKPDNALIDAEGRVRVVDFGLAVPRGGGPVVAAAADPTEFAALRSRGGSTWPEGQVTRGLTGTPAYMSPEQHRGETGDAASDQYSLCVALHEGLYGARPFAGDSVAALRRAVHVGEVPPPPPGSRVPPWLRQALLRGLAVDPERRFPDMDALLAELTRDRRRARRRALLAAAAALLVVAGGLGYRAAVDRGAALAVAAQDARCGAEADLAGVWDDARRAAVAASLRAPGTAFADATATRVVERLDAHAAEWARARVELCRGAPPAADVPLALRVACLDDRRRELGALVDALADPDVAALEHAVAGAAGLAPARDCDGPAALRASQPGADAAVRDALVQARALEVAGRFAAGLARAREAADRAERVGDRRLLAEARLREGVLADLAGDYPAAEVALTAAAWAAEAAGHDLALAEAAVELTTFIGVRRARHAEAAVWAGLAQAVTDRLGAGETRLQADLWASRGELRAHEARFAEARDELDRALALHVRLAGEVDLRVAQTHSDLGNVLRVLGEYDEAIDHYRAAKAIRERLLGDAHPQVAMVHNNLGAVHHTRGDLDAAEADYRRAIALWEAALGPDHPSLGHALANLGSLLQTRREYPQARALAERSLAVWERAYGADHPDLISPLVTLGNILQDLGELDAARAVHERALALTERAFGPDHLDVAYTLINLGMIAEQQGRPEDARRDLDRAVAQIERTLGPEHEMLGLPLATLGELDLAAGDLARARARLERALQRLPPKHRTARGEAGFLLARTLRAEGRDAEAVAAAGAALADYAAVGEPAEARVAEIRAWLAGSRRGAAPGPDAAPRR